MLQALPGASDALIDQTIKRIDELPALSTSFLDGMTPEDLAHKILGTDCKILEKTTSHSAVTVQRKSTLESLKP